MASFVAQLVDVLYGLIERVTGYGRGEEKGVAGAQEPNKLASAEVLRTGEVIEIRSRDSTATGGSKAQVNLDGL